MKFSVIIPTYNREKDLGDCLNSILRQILLPSEVLIVDDGELPSIFIDEFKEKFKNRGIRFIYYQKDHSKERRGSSESRNIGFKMVSQRIVFILDDDVILDDDFFEKIIEVWRENKNPKLIGVAGIIKNYRKKSKLEKFYNKIFGLSSKYLWDVNEAGFQVWDDGIRKREKGYYAHGGDGGCSYNKDLVQRLNGFKIFEGGRGANDDVEFCLKAKKAGYYFIIEPNAKTFHKQSLSNREKNFLIGFKESYYRKIIFSLYCKKDFWHKIWFCWANIGWILRQFLSGHFTKLLGMVFGLLNILSGKVNKKI